MKVRRERPSQRLNHRISAPIRADIDDVTYDAVDWSLGGFSLESYTAPAQLGDTITATIHIPFQGFEITFQAEAKIKRLDEHGNAGFAFVDLDERERELMTHFIDSLVRGSMSVVDDTILRIDSPVTPVSIQPDLNPDEAVPLRRRSLKAILYTAFYFTAGLMVVGYTFLVLHSNFVRMEIQSAVVSAPVQPLLATTDGLIKNVLVTQNELIKQRTPVVSFSNTGLQQRIEMARVRVDRALLTLRAREKETTAEREKFGDYSLIAHSEIKRLTIQIRSLQERSTLVHNKVERFSNLRKELLITQDELDEAKLNFKILSSELEEARQLMSERRELLDSIEAGRFFDGRRLEGHLQEREAAAELASDEVMLAKDELSTLFRENERLVISAPNDGHLLTIYKAPGATVKRGEQVALFERNEIRTIEAFLTQEEVLEIGLGDEATAYFPSLGQKVRSIVTDIDRTQGYIDELSSRYRWRGPKDRTAQITLQFLNIPLHEVRANFPPGLPVVVIFKRRNTDIRFLDIWSWFTEKAQT